MANQIHIRKNGTYHKLVCSDCGQTLTPKDIGGAGWNAPLSSVSYDYDRDGIIVLCSDCQGGGI